MRVLLVEDDMMIAGRIAPVVGEAGHQLVALAADRETAVALLRSMRIDLAFVDVHLADGWTGVDVARVAAEQDVPAVFMTANPSALPDDLAGARGLIAKPYTQASLKAALLYLADMIAGEQPGAPPSGLKIADTRARLSAPNSVA